MTSAQTGRVRFYAERYGRRFGFCSIIVRKGGAATCTMRIPNAGASSAWWCAIPRTSRLHLPGVTVTATLSRHGKLLAKRRASAH